MDKINPATAANAYANMASKAARGDGLTVADGGSFSNLIKQAAVDSIETMKAGEKMSAAAVLGKADLTDVVAAVTAAELTLQTVVSLRDRMLQSYQEIMRMPV